MTKTSIPFIKSVSSSFSERKLSRTTLFTVVLMFFFIPIKAQTYFHKYLEPTLSVNIFPQVDGTYRVLGMSLLINASDSTNIIFIKLDSLGEVIYRKDISSDYLDDNHHTIQIRNKFIIDGLSGNNSDTNKRRLAAIDLEGNLIWHGRYGNHSNIMSYITSFTENNNNIIATAILPVNDSTNINGFSLFETDSNGIFKKGQAFYSPFNIGANFILKSKIDNFYLILGGYCPLSSPCFGLYFITKVDENFNVIWSKSYKNALYDYVSGNIAGYILPREIIEKEDGNLILYGSVVDSTGNSWNPFLSVFDNNGNTINSIGFSYNSSTGTFKNSFITSKDSGFVFTGEHSGGISLFKLDKNLNIEWIKRYPNIISVMDIKQTNDEGFIFLGQSGGYAQTWGIYPPIGIIKTDKYGNSGCFEQDTMATTYPINVYDSVFTLQSYDEGFQSASSTTTFYSPMQSYTHCFCSVTGGFTYTANGDTLEFTNTTTGASSYTWNFDDGNTSTDFSPTHVYDTSGTYNVSLVVQDGICIDTVYQTITIVGIKENKNPLHFSVYPNPSFYENVQFTTTEQGVYNLKITDLTGKLIDNLSFKGKQYTYQSKHLSTGLYFYEITNEKKVKSRGKLVKR